MSRIIIFTTILLLHSLRSVNAVKNGPYSIRFPILNITTPLKFLVHVVRTNDEYKQVISGQEIIMEALILPCYKVGKHERTSCYDQELGNFVEFQTTLACIEEICYYLKNTTGGEIDAKLMNLGAADINNLKQLITAEHTVNEEVRQNFGLVVHELEHIRTIMAQTILSIAKIDDTLLGTILNNKARSEFINEKNFYLTQREEIENGNSNCNIDKYFKNGRWQLKTDETVCYKVMETQSIDILKFLNLTFETEPRNETYDNVDGWTSVTREQIKMREELHMIKIKQSKKHLQDLSRDTNDNIKLTVTIIQLIGYIVLVAWVINLHRKIARPNATDSTYMSFAGKEPEPTCSIEVQGGELNRILKMKQNKTKQTNF